MFAGLVFCEKKDRWMVVFHKEKKPPNKQRTRWRTPFAVQAMEAGEHVNRNLKCRWLVQRPASLAQGVRDTAGQAGHDDTQVAGSLAEPQHRDHVCETSQLGLSIK
jgi:hypothetical protein